MTVQQLLLEIQVKGLKVQHFTGKNSIRLACLGKSLKIGTNGENQIPVEAIRELLDLKWIKLRATTGITDATVTEKGKQALEMVKAYENEKALYTHLQASAVKDRATEQALSKAVLEEKDLDKKILELEVALGKLKLEKQGNLELQARLEKATNSTEVIKPLTVLFKRVK